MRKSKRVWISFLLTTALLVSMLTSCAQPIDNGTAQRPTVENNTPLATYIEAIPFIYDEALDFSDGLAAVCLNGKWGYIDKTGAEIIPPIYSVAQPFSEGLAVVGLEADGLVGYIDKTGVEVIPPTFNGANPFSEGLAAVQIGDDKGLEPEIFFIDKTGATITPLYYSADDFNEGMAMVQDGMSHYVWIDHSGTVLLEAGGTNRGTSFSEGMAMIYHTSNERFIDTTGSEVISLENYPGVNDVQPFSDGLALVRGHRDVEITKEESDAAADGSAPPMAEPKAEPTGENGMTRESVDGYIDKTGELVIELPDVSSGSSFSEGLAAVTTFSGNPRGCGFIDKTGTFVIEPNPSWQWTFDFNEGYAAVQSADDDLWGFIDKWGNQVVPCIYELPEYYTLKISEGMAALSLNDKWGFIQISG